MPFGYERQSRKPLEGGVTPLRQRATPQAAPGFYDALFASDQFGYDDLNKLVRETDPYIGSDILSGARGYRDFADLTNATRFGNEFRTQFAEAKDKKAVQERLAALKNLGLSDRDAELNVNNPKYLDYFQRNEVAPRYKTYYQPMATKRGGGRTIEEGQRYENLLERAENKADVNDILANRALPRELDRIRAIRNEDVAYKAALRDEGLVRDYFDPNQVGRRRANQEEKDYAALLEEANRQHILADGSGLNLSKARPEDVIGAGLAKRISRVADYPALIARVETDADAAANLVTFVASRKRFAPSKTVVNPADKITATATADALNKQLKQADALRPEYESALYDAEEMGLIFKNGQLIDPTSGKSYFRPPNNPNEEEAYFARLPASQPAPSATVQNAGYEGKYFSMFPIIEPTVRKPATRNPYSATNRENQLSRNRRISEQEKILGLTNMIETGRINVDLAPYGGNAELAAAEMIASGWKGPILY